MGQHPSKRRSYTPGQDVQSEIPSSLSVNGDVKGDVTLNGGIVEHRDVTASTSVPSTTSTGKKEKRRKLRFVGFPIRRTPSGRWTRKRRSVKANGATTRPVSCPVTSLTEETETPAPRPQSLFIDEVTLHQDGDAHVDTVDLSDHEDGKGKPEVGTAAAPVPKPREKKAKRLSNKKQDSKKKKEKKKDSKKDKEKGKSKKPNGETLVTEESKTADHDKHTDLSIQDTAVDISTSEQPPEDESALNYMAASIVEETLKNAKQQLMSEHAAVAVNDNNIESTNSPDIAVDLELKEVNDAMEMPVTISQSESIPSPSEESVPAEVAEDEIVPMKAPEKIYTMPDFSRFGESNEDHKEEKETIQTRDTADNDENQISEFALKVEADKAVAEAEKIEVEVEALMVSSTRSSVCALPKLSNDGDVEVVEESIAEQKVDKVKTMLNVDFDNDDHTAFSEPDKDKESPFSKEEGTDRNSDVLVSVSQDLVVDVHDNIEGRIGGIEEKSGEILEKKTDQAEVVVDADFDAIASNVSQKLSDYDSKDQTAPDTVNDAAQSSFDTAGKMDNIDQLDEASVEVISPSLPEENKELKAKAAKEQKENERVEKERIRKQKEEEKAKEKVRLREEKRKKAEEKAADRAKTRGDRKSLPQRISSWFKKDRHKYGTTSAHPDTPTSVEAPSSPIEDSAPNSPDPVAEALASSSSSPLGKESLTVDVSVQPISSACQDNAKSSPSSSVVADATSPDFAPVSPNSEADFSLNSDSSVPVTPSSDDADKSGPPGALKKINLGPRLRTAILKKKSSNASDSGQEDSRVSLTQPKCVETAELTPPPRKLRPRKTAEKYTPITKGAHNPPKSQSLQLDARASGGDPSAEDENLTEEGEDVPTSPDAKEVQILHEADDNSEAVVSSVVEEIVGKTEAAIVSPDEGESADNGETIRSNVENVVLDHAESASTMVTDHFSPPDDDADAKEFVSEEIVQASQNTGVIECQPTVGKTFECEQSDASAVVTIERDVSQLSHTSARIPALDLDISGSNKDQPTQSGDEEEEVNVVESPSLVSTATIVFKLASSENPPEQESTAETSEESISETLGSTTTETLEESISLSHDISTTEKSDESISTTLEGKTTEISEQSLFVTFSSEVPKDEACISDPTDSIAVKECVQLSSTEIPESSQAVASTEPQRLQEESSAEYVDSQVLDCDVSLPVTIAVATDGLETSSSLSPESPLAKDKEEEEEEADRKASLSSDDDDDTEVLAGTQLRYTTVCSAEIKADIHEEPTSVDLSPTQLEEEAETCFITLPGTGQDSAVTNGQWTTDRVLDIHLDDSAIEMDKESPLADSQDTGSPVNCKEDDGVGSGSDNSSDCNDGNKSGPSATIDAYLKLQQQIEPEIALGHQMPEVNGTVSSDLSST